MGIFKKNKINIPYMNSLQFSTRCIELSEYDVYLIQMIDLVMHFEHTDGIWRHSVGIYMDVRDRS